MIWFLHCLIAVTILTSQVKDSTDLAVTIYPKNFAMVKDTRKIFFDKGNSDIYFTDVSSLIQPETVTFKPLKKTEAIRIFEQNFEKNIINQAALLEKMISKDIQLYIKLGEQLKTIEGTYLGNSNGEFIVKTETGLGVYKTIEGFKDKSKPQGFFIKPTLHWKASSKEAAEVPCQVAYRARGLTWTANYIIVLTPSGEQASFKGDVKIDNHSGKHYEQASLKLIAGEVHTEEEINSTEIEEELEDEAEEQSEEKDDEVVPAFTQKTFSDYHMYTLNTLMDLEDNSQKLVQFIPERASVSVDKYYQIDLKLGRYAGDVNTFLKLDLQNNQNNNLGIPLPEGRVQIFVEDSESQQIQFLGDSRFENTPSGENITMNIKAEHDIQATLKYDSMRRFRGGHTAHAVLTINNFKDIQADVRISLNTLFSNDNLLIFSESKGVSLKKQNSRKYTYRRAMQPHEKFQLKWYQDQRQH